MQATAKREAIRNQTAHRFQDSKYFISAFLYQGKNRGYLGSQSDNRDVLGKPTMFWFYPGRESLDYAS
jgi:hypothetical protein